MHSKPRIAVVSPFVDRQHGTERCLAEQIERFAQCYEVHLYSNRVEGVDLTNIVWHKIPTLPGPHLLAYCWWFVANHLWRWWDRGVANLSYDLLYSPGINCVDADLISVHIVFAEFRRRMQSELSFRSAPIKMWSRLLHRSLYYLLIETLERFIYTRKDLPLVVVSQKVAADLGRCYGKTRPLTAIYHGWDPGRFGPNIRARLRAEARQTLGLAENDFALLLIGNDWKNKGFASLLQAVALLDNPAIKVLAVGTDLISSYEASASPKALRGRIRFLSQRSDVEYYYAAADSYVGPSLNDAFGMPPLEAMACGLPVIVSRQAGVSEVISHGVDGLILEDPRDSVSLAAMIHDLCVNADLRNRLGQNAAQTSLRYSWDKNGAQLRVVIDELLATQRRGEQQPAPAGC